MLTRRKREIRHLHGTPRPEDSKSEFLQQSVPRRLTVHRYIAAGASVFKGCLQSCDSSTTTFSSARSASSSSASEIFENRTRYRTSTGDVSPLDQTKWVLKLGNNFGRITKYGLLLRVDPEISRRLWHVPESASTTHSRPNSFVPSPVHVNDHSTSLHFDMVFRRKSFEDKRRFSARVDHFRLAVDSSDLVHQRAVRWSLKMMSFVWFSFPKMQNSFLPN